MQKTCIQHGRNCVMFRNVFEKLQDKRKKTAAVCPIPENQKPILHKSICTGETTAGFKDPGTGKYTEMMLIRNEKDLKQFMKEYGITERPETEY